jgi:hypothetical protein
MIIVYSKYEDFVVKDRHPSLIGLIFPQWFCTNCVKEEDVITIPASPERAIVCSFQQIDHIARRTWREISKNTIDVIKKVYFFHSPNVVTMNGKQPFDVIKK